jgi:tRNA (mo5U34)-methyltransferase
MNRRELVKQIESLGPWFHNFDLGGVSTAPQHALGDYPRMKWERFARSLPDLKGKTVLDIGCNAGFHSFEAIRRGAAHVTAIDHHPRYLAQARLAAEVLGVKHMDIRELDVYDVHTLDRRFDFVMFMGVLYHLRHPLLALDRVHQVVGRELLFQSMLRGSDDVAVVAPDYDFFATEHFEDPGYPRMYFVERRYAGDPTNWWIPNRACAEALLRTAGFEIMSRLEAEVYLCRRRAED